MAVIFREEGIKKKAKPALKETRIHLTLAESIFSSLTIPHDFKYANLLKKYPRDMTDIQNEVRSIEKWLDKTIVDFENVENNTKRTVNKLQNKVDSINKTYQEEVKKTVEKTVEPILKSTSTIAKMIREAELKNEGKTFLEKARDGICSVGASIGNGAVSFFKGVGEFGEGIVDTLGIVGTAIASPFTGLYDGFTYLIDGGEDWESVTGKMWEGTMSFVAEDHVDNLFQNFYENTEVGKWLDEHAFGPFKSDGMGCQIISGVGYVAGVVVLTIATMGIGSAVGIVGASTASATTVSAGIATASATGKYTSEYWAQKRDSSWEGIERFYQKGEISEEQYNSYKMIRSLNEEQWKEIELDYQNGNLTKEQYDQIKQIRELPEDWTTLENGLKGLGYGAANGAWEGIQWYVGGKLAGSILSESTLANSAIRVGADTGFNALDTPFRTTLESITSGEDWEQAWINQGGWQSVLSNMGIGLVGSVGGEVVDLSKIKKGMTTLNNNKLFNNVDKSTADKVKVAIMKDYANGKIDLSKISDTELAKVINNKIKALDAGNIDEAFKYVSSIDKNIIKGLYWFETADGRVIKPFSPEYKQATKSGMKLIKRGNSTYFDIKSTLINKYNMSSSEASKYISNAMQNIKSNNISINTANIDDIFEYCSIANGKYGVDQGILKDLYFWQAPDGTKILPTEISKYVNSNITLKKVAHTEYFEVKNALMTKYNMSSLDASKVLSALDSIGACSYASAANDIVGHFKDNPDFFKKIFGFPLYKKANNGKLKINATDLLTDMYIFVNHTNNGGKLITTDMNR